MDHKHRTKKNNAVYVLIDPRYEPEKHSLWSFIGRPFYVGRTCKVFARYYEHAVIFHQSFKSRLKTSIIQKIRADGLEPKLRVVANGLSVKEANALEMRMIRLIGRRVDNDGPLANMTGGGDGTVRKIWTAEQREHLRKVNYDKFLPIHLEKLKAWSKTCKYVEGFSGQHAKATYRCKTHGLFTSIAREVTRRIDAGNSPCTECNKPLIGVNIRRGKKGLPPLRLGNINRSNKAEYEG
jgi:hypothetical protein